MGKDVTYCNLADNHRTEWVRFVEQAYGRGHILANWDHLRWFYGPPARQSETQYDTLVATLPDGRIIGTYGVIPAEIRAGSSVYSLCWYVNGMVLPEYRNQGIGKGFIDILLNRFDVNGGLGFNKDVKRNYERYGFTFFGDRTLRRFIKILDAKAYDLVEKIGGSRRQAQDMVAISQNPPAPDISGTPLRTFHESARGARVAIPNQVRVCIHRTAPYLNWRYFMNPLLKYEVTGIISDGALVAYLIARHERFAPTDIFGTRIIDLMGSPDNASRLITNKAIEAVHRGDSFIEFMFAGSVYVGQLTDLKFTELTGPAYEWWPLVSSPIEYRQNLEFICLGSRKYPNLFDSYGFGDLYFTRGDSDRDRANRLKDTVDG